jgi:hypothetical protein
MLRANLKACTDLGWFQKMTLPISFDTSRFETTTETLPPFSNIAEDGWRELTIVVPITAVFATVKMVPVGKRPLSGDRRLGRDLKMEK